jgi:hypothetical protein
VEWRTDFAFDSRAGTTYPAARRSTTPAPMQKLNIVMGSLLGACAIHFTLAACGNSGKSSVDTTGDAHAQTTSSTCASWTIASFQSPVTEVNQNGIVLSAGVTPGWEPISAEFLTAGGVNAVVRQCTQ